MKKHKHAELMALYARDAAETETPWKRWEYKAEDRDWGVLVGHPAWSEKVDYRRKTDDAVQQASLLRNITEVLDEAGAPAGFPDERIAWLRNRVKELEQTVKSQQLVYASFKNHVKTALDNAGVPTHRPYIGTTAPKPMTPSERIASLGVRAKELQGLRELAQEHKDARDRVLSQKDWILSITSYSPGYFKFKDSDDIIG